ncbi:MAG: hypothetical protein SGARI_003049, partial [Bacillariaceae sp.]
MFNNNNNKNEGRKQELHEDEKKEAEGNDPVEVNSTRDDETETDTKCPNIGALLGVDLVKNPKTKLFEVKDHVLDASGNAPQSTFLSAELAALLRPGDVLESVNGVACRRSGDVNELYQKIVTIQDEQETTTLYFVCKAAEKTGDSQQQQRPIAKQPI